jgi:glutathionylspermidine synthase
VFQWNWFGDAVARQIIPRDADQFNSLRERLIAVVRRFAREHSTNDEKAVRIRGCESYATIHDGD